MQAALTRHLQALAAQLPATQNLRVEFTDIDLAGHLKPLYRSGQDIRVLTGRTDWPRLALHYHLSSAGTTLASGDESLADMGYLQHTLSLRDGDALPLNSACSATGSPGASACGLERRLQRLVQRQVLQRQLVARVQVQHRQGPLV